MKAEKEKEKETIVETVLTVRVSNEGEVSYEGPAIDDYNILMQLGFRLLRDGARKEIKAAL